MKHTFKIGKETVEIDVELRGKPKQGETAEQAKARKIAEAEQAAKDARK